MSRKFVIVSAPRTGSTLLVKTLNSLDAICCHGELLAPNHVRGYEDGAALIYMSKAERESRMQGLLQERDADPVEFIDRALDTGAATAGFKVLYNAFLNPRWSDVIRHLQNQDNIRFIHLTRENALRRFISEQISGHGGPIHSAVGGKNQAPVSVHIDIDLFLRRSAELATQARELTALLSQHTVLETNYESLAADTPAAVARVCHFLGLDTAYSDIKPALEKVGAKDLEKSVSNYPELLNHPATRELALAD